MVKGVEDILSENPNIVSAVEALSTFAAVVVSLVIALWAQRANRTKLVARMYLADLFMNGLKTIPQYLTVSITNIGIMPLRIPTAFLYRKMPFLWNVFLEIPLDSFKGDPYIQQQSYPVEIPPRANRQFHVGTPDLPKKRND